MDVDALVLQLEPPLRALATVMDRPSLEALLAEALDDVYAESGEPS